MLERCGRDIESETRDGCEASESCCRSFGVERGLSACPGLRGLTTRLLPEQTRVRHLDCLGLEGLTIWVETAARSVANARRLLPVGEDDRRRHREGIER